MRLLLALILLTSGAAARCATETLAERIRSLQVVACGDWLNPPVIVLGSDETVEISFDEMTTEYHRFICHLEHVAPDGTPSADLFESDYISGFNDLPIDDYATSIQTTVPYTHYRATFPNEQCRMKKSGRYRVTVRDESADNEPVLTAEFEVVDRRARLALTATDNTDIDVRKSHQQLAAQLDYQNLRVVSPDEQIFVVATQNCDPQTAVVNPRPDLTSQRGLQWSHCRDLIFTAGNEYRKFEAVALSHATMGIDRVWWDGSLYHAEPFAAEPRPNYIYDEDADGAFTIRNSDNIDNDIASDYLYIHYRLNAPEVSGGEVYVAGRFANSADRSQYRMTYDEANGCYQTAILQKQGYYSYVYKVGTADGRMLFAPSEGDYYQTENSYQFYVYYREQGARAWQLVEYRQVIFK